ncbi:DUF3325 domain-containing protein [Acetobacter senegalensis]|uniref:DUF3325 domain-containing protein n=1 Tax=Acetobacter senegalensis TaxID=446692 RepID=UPI00264ECFA1|nr:DUF3325 domain-containing protein [Acetobacter senegalensis]MDN7354365.1 DUF3325 domain-containing protein [Acetobacter senegalensis]
MVDCLFSFGLGLMLFVGFALLALTQFVHRRATGTAELPPRRGTQVRLVAILLLVLALVLAVQNEGGGFGFLLWAGLMSFAACGVALILGYWPYLLAPVARTLEKDLNRQTRL